MDRIRIGELRVPVRVGVGDDERGHSQAIVVNIDIGAELNRAGLSDELEDTVDYHAVVRAVAAELRTGEAHLLERLAEKTAAVVLGFAGVLEVAIEVCKEPPPMAEDVATVSVRVERRK